MASPLLAHAPTLWVSVTVLVLVVFVAAVAAWALFLTVHVSKKVGDAATTVAAVSAAVQGIVHGVNQTAADVADAAADPRVTTLSRIGRHGSAALRP
jgi:multidrug resistance efflux pump